MIPTPPTWLTALRGKFIAFEGPDGSGKTTQYRRLMALLHEHKIPVCEVREPGGTPIGESVRQILLHTKDDMTLRCEMLLYMASRAQLVQERIRPAMLKGDVVLADRFVASTLAYQGSAGGLPIDEIKAVAQVAVQSCWPDLNLVFDVDEDTAARRISPIIANTADPSLFLPPGPPSSLPPLPSRKGLGEGSSSSSAAAPSATSPSPSQPSGKGGRVFEAGEGSSSTREHHAPDRIESRGREFHRKVRFGYLEQVKQNPKAYAVIDAAGSLEQVWERLVRELGKRFG